MGQFSKEIFATSTQFFSRMAAEQGGVLSGDNPAKYNHLDPFRLWVIQLVIILFMTHALSLILGKIRQPRVISEIIGGIILGPTVMGRIPNFQDTIFPSDSMPLLNLTSTIGLIFYLFLVGLEIDTRIVKRHAAASVAISLAGLVFPLGLGAAVGIGVYREFLDQSINFGYFVLFVAVAVGITAFPVLCRILTELKLLDTTVGVVTLSAGAGNDIIGWVLLALAAALVNTTSGLTALWVLLCCVGYVILLLYPMRWTYVWLARRTGSLEQGAPTATMMTITLLVVLISAFFTDIIGVHAIFGGFLTGLIIPHENGFAISLVEKLEDLVSILLLPIYFALSGLRTNLGTLNNGITWGYTILICVISFMSKFCGCGVVALLGKFNWREAGAIGALMSCKGLVGLIVLNIGLSAGILDTRTFSMFIVHAVILTFMTTPLVLWFYPERVRKHEGEFFHGKHPEEARSRTSTSDDGFKTKMTIVLDRIEQLPAAIMLSQLINNNIPIPSSASNGYFDEKADILNSDNAIRSLSRTSSLSHSPLIHIDALRLIELTTRASVVLKSQKADSLLHNDPVISIFRTFGVLNKLEISASLSLVSYDEYPDAIARRVQESDSQLVILPWSRGSVSIYETGDAQSSTQNPFDGVFHKSSMHIQDQTSSIVYSEFIRSVFLRSPSDVALFVDRGFSAEMGSAEHHLFLPFFGGPDDRLALTFLVQLCHNPLVTATVIHVTKTRGLSPMSTIAGAEAGNTLHHTTLVTGDTIYGDLASQTCLVSSTADSIIWDKYTTASEARSGAMTAALSRITFGYESSLTPLRTVVALSLTMSTQNPPKTVTIVLGRSRRMPVESHEVELQQILSEAGGYTGSSVSKTLGDVGAAIVAKGIHTNLLVMQAATVNSS